MKINSIFVLILIILLGQRIAINIANYQFGVGFIAFYLFVMMWVIEGKVLINKKKFFLFVAASFGIIISAAISATYSDYYSLPSLLQLLGLYFLTVFVFKENQHSFTLNLFQKITFIIAIIGILQFLTQLLGIAYKDWLFFIPEENMIANYNYDISIEFGSNIYKSNGIFLQEPSTYSQIIALSILAELYYFKKYFRLFILIIALLVSFSGTGVLLLAIGLIPLIFKLKLNRLIIFGTIACIGLLIFFYSGFASHTFNRIYEFQNPYASGYIRFIAPYQSYLHLLRVENIPTILFGLGPGASDRYIWPTPTHFNPIIKLLVEYGFSGLLFFLYIMYVFFARQKIWLAFAIFLIFTFLSGSLLTPHTTVLFFLLLPLNQTAQISSRQK